MAISKQPPKSILPAYRPVAFELYIDVLTSARVAVNAVVRIYKNGTAISDYPIRFKTSRNEVSPLSGLDTRYYWDVDIQKYCQDTLAPYLSLSSGFVSPITVKVKNTDMYGVYYFTVDYEVKDLTTGLLEDSSVDQEVTDEFTIFSSSRNNDENMFLDDYYGTLGSGNTKFLTKSSRTLTVCLDENVYLSYITPLGATNINTALVTLYDSSNSVLSQGVTSLTQLLEAEQQTVNTGTASLGFATYFDGSVDFTDTALSYYTFSAGTADTNDGLGTYEAQTEVFTYLIDKNCCPEKAIRLHWMNLLGGIDSFTFDSSKDLQLTATSETGKKALGWNTGSTSPHKINSIGSFKYDSRGQEQYLISSGLLKNNEALFLSDLLTSPEVYIDLNGINLAACKVENTTQSITRNDGKITYNLVLTLSNERIIHRT